jgi:hypothetical protein
VQPVVSRFVATFLHIERCRMLRFGDALQVRERTAKLELSVALGIVFAGNFGKRRGDRRKAGRVGAVPSLPAAGAFARCSDWFPSFCSARAVCCSPSWRCCSLCLNRSRYRPA